MNEHELASKIVQRLNRGLNEMQEDEYLRLQSVRRIALEHYRDSGSAIGWGWVLHTGRFHFGRHFSILHYAVAALLLFISVAGVSYWHWRNTSDDDTDIEISLLTGEVPINAYLDNEFEAWIKRSEE